MSRGYYSSIFQPLPELLRRPSFETSRKEESVPPIPETVSAEKITDMDKKRRYKTESGFYDTEKKIADGGEGIVFILSDDRFCAKIYKKPMTRQSYDRLCDVISRFNRIRQRNPALYKHLAPPKEILFDRNNRPLGYVMDNIHAKMLNYYQCSKILLDEQYTREHQFMIGEQITWIMSELHRSGIIIGDVASVNILVDDRYFVYFVDLNGIGFSEQDRIYHSKGIHPEYLSPEHIGNMSEQFICRREDDVWALQLILYELFMPGFEPYNYRGNLTLEQDTQNGNFFWLRKNAVVSELGEKLFESYPYRLKNAFYDCFHSHGKYFYEKDRLTANQWFKIIRASHDDCRRQIN